MGSIGYAPTPAPPPWGAPLSVNRQDAAAFESTVRPSSGEGPGGYGASPALVPFIQPRQSSTPPEPQPRVATDPGQVGPTTSRVLAGFLVSFDGAPHGVFWPLYQGINEIGRLEAASGLHVEIDHPTTSSQHARIVAVAHPGRLKLEDLGSTNGTFVNGQRVEPGQRVDLGDGDSIRFGGFNTIAKLVTV